ncbi:MAG: hypothetical protein LWW85_01950 [Marinilabiliales bacterium]|nr:hypothetical protein [Marinilabiliales bacterium]
MQTKLTGVLLLLLTLGFYSAVGQPIRFDKDGMAILNGKRTFMIGTYEFPQKEEELKQVAAAGFNLIQVPLQDSVATKKNLDRAAQMGLCCWITGDFDLSVNAEKKAARLKTMIRLYAGHPALSVWEVPDEALWNVWTKAWDYRAEKEPKLLKEAVSERQESSRIHSGMATIQSIKRCYEQGDFAHGQMMADSLWTALGKKPPHPELDMEATAANSVAVAHGLRRGYQMMKILDPRHPVLMNHAPRNRIEQLALYNQAADVTGCDIYPVPEYKIGHSDLVDRSMASVGAYTRRMREAAPGKPVWMVLQAFAWADLFKTYSQKYDSTLRLPTASETRFMAFDAIVNGARGINYWGTTTLDKSQPFWKSFLASIREIADQREILSCRDARRQPKPEIEESYNSFDMPVRILAKQTGKKATFLVVNENMNKNPVFCKIKQLQEGQTYRDLLSGDRCTVSDNQLRFPMTGQAVRIWSPIDNQQ